jgi:prephenate dehydratase
MNNVTFLGPAGATFSHDAYDALAQICGTPPAITESSTGNCVPAASNDEILELIIGHGGYGAIAMQTFAEGRYAKPLESFIALLERFISTDDCPIRVATALSLKIHFCLMARKGRTLNDIKHIIAHEKAIGACRGRITDMHLATTEVPSNGEAARRVAEDDIYAAYGALGPRSAAEKYGLEILHDAFETGVAVTTFFLITPKAHKVFTGDKNQALIVFKTKNCPGALVDCLLPLKKNGLNMIQIYSVHVWNNTYDYAIEVEVKNGQLTAFDEAMKEFRQHVLGHILFGPFQVLSNEQMSVE